MGKKQYPYNDNVDRLMEILIHGGTWPKESDEEEKVYRDEPIRKREADAGQAVTRQHAESTAWKPENPPVHRVAAQKERKQPSDASGRTGSVKAEKGRQEPVGEPVFRISQYRAEESLEKAPKRIRECKMLARTPEGYRMPKEELFYCQGVMMADYEDNAPYFGNFSWYFPTYQAMNVAELRGYFTWRTALRDGEITQTSLSFAFVYVYELLHGIGVENYAEGFERLYAFWQYYREFEPQLDRYMRTWLCDYVVYYGLEKSCLARVYDVFLEEQLSVFMHSQECSDAEYFEAIRTLSAYSLDKSKFYKEYPEDVCAVTCAVFRSLTDYYEKHGKKSIVEKYFGTKLNTPYQMFAGAVFYDFKKYRNYEYVVNEIHRYRCLDGRWSCERIYGFHTKSKDMGFVLHEIDRKMREHYHYSQTLQPEGMTKNISNMIEKAITRYLAEKEKNARPVIEIDVTKLSGIRAQAAVTRDRLLVEENEPETAKAGKQQGTGVTKPRQVPESDCSESSDKETKKQELPYGLSSDEAELLARLLNEQDYREFLRSRHLMLTVAAEQINEKLFDLFGDTVILFDGDTPQITEDYADEVRKIIAGS